jgi:hypothetical protein
MTNDYSPYKEHYRIHDIATLVDYRNPREIESKKKPEPNWEKH